MKYLYPAIFKYDKAENVYIVEFPDIKGCYTDGDTLEEAAYNAQDVLSLMLWNMEEVKETVPAATKPENIKVNANSFMSLVTADTAEYKKKYSKKVVKKTLSIPEWINTLAIENNVNFSGVLQDALKEKLKV